MSAALMSLPALSASFRSGPLVAGLAAWLLVLAGGWWLLHSDETRQIAQIQIDGDFHRVSASTVRAALASYLHDGFVEVRLDQVKSDLENLPWVARARVERAWPAGIRIRVWEREPLALWGSTSLLDTQGFVFTPAVTELPQHLPRLQGEPGQEREVMKGYDHLSRRLQDSPFALAGLSRDIRGEWLAVTQSGIGLRLGQELSDDKLTLLRDTVAPLLRDRMHEVDYVDLRYTNGFAVGWKQQPVAATGEENG